MQTQISKVKAQILALVAWADGAFTDSEQDVFVRVLDASELDDDTRLELVDYIEHPPDKAEALTGLAAVPVEEAADILRVAFALALADGSFDDAERGVIDEILDRLGIEGEERTQLYATLEAQAS
jgi:tellurite resistance protein